MFKKICLVLTIIGALNWGIIGFLGVDAIGSLFAGTYSMISRIIYALVGIAGIILIPSLFSSNDNENR